MYTSAILGFGRRGIQYGDYLKNNGVKIVAVCDTNSKRLEIAKIRHELTHEALFSEAEAFFAEGKIADCLVISTMDGTHAPFALRALDLGYDILLEKPVATTMQDCLSVYRKAKDKGRKVVVCHCLRYTPFYGKIKEILESGAVGKPVTVTQTENVAYWHQAQSFIRGNWRNSKESSPMIVQKCCHDLDILYWLIGKPCVCISSMGNLYYYKEENAPKNSAEYCFECPIKDDCEYNCLAFYLKKPFWPATYYGSADDKEAIIKHFSDKNNRYSKCVFRSDNDVVDHQVVNMLFSGGETAQLTMTAFSERCTRTIKVHCTKGEIVGDMDANYIEYTVFGKKKEVIAVKDIAKDIMGHGGGDVNMVRDFVSCVRDGAHSVVTEIGDSLMSYKMAFAAEESRLDKGRKIDLQNYMEE